MDEHCKPVAGQPRPALTVLCISIAMAIAGISTPLAVVLADDLPQGGQVVGGQATIQQNGKAMQIDTAGERTAIDWHSFSVGPNNQITFNQPNGRSVTLNRVLGGDPSKIYGAVTSNGQLILVNPAGVWLGPNSHVSSSALVASAGFLTDEQARQFAATGKLDIKLTGAVTNQGRITVHDNGMVALLGAQVSNAGVIQAKKGTVQLATGPQATLDFHGDGLLNIAMGGEPGDKSSVNTDVTGGVHNSGHIDVGNGVVAMDAAKAAKHLDSVINLGGSVVADSVTQDGGTIVLGKSAQTTVSGSLSAKGVNGGSIKVLGDAVNIADSATLDASGSQGAGGKVLVGGSFQGKGPEPSAKNTTVAKGASLKADGKTHGGQIVVWSDDKTHFAGSASAKGGKTGGLVETSGKRLTVTQDARVSTTGAEANGTWLLDPATVNVESTDTDGSGEGSVAASAIVSGLANGDVTIQATSALNINAPIIATNFATVNNDGRVSKSTLALISSGNPGTISAYTGSDKSNTSGAVNIRAPVLLKDGNLFISATGNIRLIDNAGSATGDAAYNKRAIIDVGSGVAWLKTAITASIFQDSNTALIADKVALDGASVRMESGLNYAGTLAGQASNGIFRFSQTNASGAAPITTAAVTSPLTGEYLTGIKAYTLTSAGSQTITAYEHANETYRDVTLSAGGAQFDYIVFEATSYTGRNGGTISAAQLAQYLDSSDYLVHGLSFTDTTGVKWQLIPDATKQGLTKVLRNGNEVSAPVGFSLKGIGGVAVSGTTTDSAKKAYWGVVGAYIPGAQNQAEIQYNEQTGSSQQLAIKLGSTTTSVLAQIGWLLNDGTDTRSNARYENAKVTFLKTQDATAQNVQITANKASITATAQDASRTYGDANPTFTQSVANDANANSVRGIDQFVDRALGRTGVTQVIPYSAATQASNVGSYAIKGGLSGDAFATKRYDLKSSDGKLTINPAELTVTANNKGKVYGDADPSLDYSVAGAKLGQAGTDLLQGNLSRQAGEDVGQYGVNKGGLGLNSGLGGNYTLKFVDGQLQITPATLTVTADNKQKTYGDADPALTYQVSGLKRGDTATQVVAGDVARLGGENVGEYGIQKGALALASGKGSNYILQFVDGVFSIVPAELTVTADGKAKVYGDADPLLSYQVSGLKRGDSAGNVLNAGSLQRQAGENVGNYGIARGSVDLNAAAGQNYILRYVDGNFAITPATLVVTADHKGKVYGDFDPSLTYNVTGLKNGDSQAQVVNGSAARDAGENVRAYGIHQGSVDLSADKGQNYVLSFVDGTFSITPATLTVSADSKTKVYGDIDPALTYQVTGLKNGDAQSHVLNDGALSRQSGENVGNYTIQQGALGLGENSNYVLTFVGNVLAVTPATLDVQAQDRSKVYGDVDPTLSYIVAGLKNGDSQVQVLNNGALARAAGEDVRAGGYTIHQGSIGLNNDQGSNYVLQFVEGKLTITPASLTVTANNKAKVYGDIDPNLSYQLAGLKNGDSASDVLTAGQLARQVGEDVRAGGYAIDQGLVELNEGKGQNYILTYQAGTFTITPAELKASANDASKVYGEVDPGLSYQVTGLKRGDQQADVLSGNVRRATGEDVKPGGYAIGQGDLALDSQNYILRYESGTFTITPASLEIDAADHSKVYGEIDPHLTYQLNGLVNGDSASDVLKGQSLGRAAGENVNTYGITQGDLALNGGKGGNYILTFKEGQLAITPAELTVTADNKTKVYGDLDPKLTYSVEGLKQGDTAAQAVHGSLARISGEDVIDGGYGILKGNVVLSSGNYTMVFREGNLQITPAALAVKADDQSKAAGTADPTLTYQVSGLKHGDNADIVQGSLQRAPGEEAGAYAIGQGSTFQAGNNYTVTFHDGVLTIDGPLAPLPPTPDVPADDPPLPPAPAQPEVASNALPLTAQSPGNLRCTALESPSAVSAGYTVSPAVARTYAVQLICKPRAYGDGTISTVPDIRDVLSYANSHFKDGRFVVPDWNRNVIPRDLKAPKKGEK